MSDTHSYKMAGKEDVKFFAQEAVHSLIVFFINQGIFYFIIC